MNTEEAIWALLSLLSVFAIPQLLGVLVFFRLVRFSRWLAFTLGTSTSPILFFFLVATFMSASFRATEAQGPVPCGMAAVAATFILLIGTAIHLPIALGIQVYLFRKSGK